MTLIFYLGFCFASPHLRLSPYPPFGVLLFALNFKQEELNMAHLNLLTYI